MLWPLYGRAAAVRRPDACLIDPLAVKIAYGIEYDCARSFRKPTSWHVIRALAIDGLWRRWLRQHTGGQVVGLGEGLETQFISPRQPAGAGRSASRQRNAPQSAGRPPIRFRPPEGLGRR
jgi:O-methyltransferase involved in polyketide biosynthesis